MPRAPGDSRRGLALRRPRRSAWAERFQSPDALGGTGARRVSRMSRSIIASSFADIATGDVRRVAPADAAGAAIAAGGTRRSGFRAAGAADATADAVAWARNCSTA